MNKDPIFHFPHASFLFLTCQGPVTRLDEGGRGREDGNKKNQMKERFLARHLEEVERDRE